MDFLHHALSCSGYTVKKYKDHLRVSGNELLGGNENIGGNTSEIIKDNSGQTVGAGLVKPIVVNDSNKIGGNLKKKIVAGNATTTISSDGTPVVIAGNIAIGGSAKKKALQKKYCF